jgi:hypothetical protein
MFKKRKALQEGTGEEATPQEQERKQVKVISLSVGHDDDDEEVVIINRARTKAAAKARFLADATAHASEEPHLATESSAYTAEAIAALREATRSKEAAGPAGTILSGEEAHNLLQESRGNADNNEEEYDVKRPPSIPIPSKDVEVVSVGSDSADDSDESGTSEEVKIGKDQSGETVESLVSDFEQVRERLEERQRELSEGHSASSNPTPANKADELKSSLQQAKSRLRTLEQLATFAKTLASCSRLKLVQLATADDVVAVWEDVKGEYKDPEEILGKFV